MAKKIQAWVKKIKNRINEILAKVLPIERLFNAIW